MLSKSHGKLRVLKNNIEEIERAVHEFKDSANFLVI